jgi:exodeoxyribonuclease V alpha subunit
MSMTQSKTFNITEVNQFKDDGWFLAKTDTGETVKGVSIFPPYGTIRTEAMEVPDRYSFTGKSWKIKKIFFDGDNHGQITLSLLGSGMLDGIKDVKAGTVYEEFGTDIWRILEAAAKNYPRDHLTYEPIDYKGEKRDPWDILEDAKGVGPVVAEMMVMSWVEKRENFTAMMNAVKCGFTPQEWKKVLKGDGTKDPEVTMEEFNKMLYEVDDHSIYDLVTLGIPFEKVDKLAMTPWPDKPAIDRFSLKRFAGVAKVAIYEGKKEGHMCVPLKIVDEYAIQLIGAPVMEELIAGDLDKFTLKMVGDMVYDKIGYKIETGISTKLREIIREPFRRLDITREEIIEEFEDVGGFTPDPLQVDAVEMALREKVMVLTGGPGTGKTTILRVLVSLLRRHGQYVRQCAFMGAAARRMKLATGFDAGTIHVAFNLFGRDKDPMFEGFLIVDELSTAPADLVYEFLRLCGNDVHIVFVGDVDQLPPVGNGEVLVQLLESQLPRVRLNTIFRNGGAIAKACHDVNNGIMPTPDNEDFFLSIKSTDDKMIEFLRKAEEHFDGKGWEKAQLLTPLNERPNVGRKALNEYFQGLRNPMGDKIPFTNIKVGDRVVQEKNIYPGFGSSLDVRNGMIGKVISRTDVAEIILANLQENGNDIQKLPITLRDLSNYIMTVMFDDEDGASEYKYLNLETISLGYCITVHKSQGSQFPCVFVVLPSNLGPLASRQILYTAMSRAKKKLFVMAAPGVVEECLKNAQRARRYSNLAQFIDKG